MQKVIDVVQKMKTNAVRNYVIAGLDSYLLGDGVIRYFECSRNHQDSITPHSHRFDFACIVLAGSVRNRLWSECAPNCGDFFESSLLTYRGDIGEHEIRRDGRDHWSYKDSIYEVGESYSMKHDEVHSIQFSRGAKVLFLEGPQLTSESLIIEPVVNGEVIRTYQKLDYMFLVDTANPTATGEVE